MHKPYRLAASLAVSLAAAMAGATAASAAPATWTPLSGPAHATASAVGSVTVKVGTTPTALTTYTCTATGTHIDGGDVFNTGSPLTGYSNGISINDNCLDGSGNYALINMTLPSGYTNVMRAEKNGSAYSLVGQLTQNIRVFGVAGMFIGSGGRTTSYTAPWTNGTPSSVAFTNARWSAVDSGPLAGQPITVTGTFRLSAGSSWLQLA